MRPDPKPYTRVIRFEWIGLHTDVAPLTVEVGVSDDGRGVYRSGPYLDTQIEKYVRRFLDHDGSLNVNVHPDQRDGYVAERKLNGPDGRVLAEFTVCLPGEELPAPDVDLSDITAVVEATVRDPQRVLSVTRCRTGAVVQVHADSKHQVRDVLRQTGYTVRVVEGVLLVSLDRPDTKS